jgi:hypothetical protein
MRALTLAAAVITLLSACAVGPDYHRPETPVDAGFANAGQEGFEANETVHAYWTMFIAQHSRRRFRRAQQ